MRNRLIAILFLSFLLPGLPTLAAAGTSPAVVQSLFVGDRDCRDSLFDCAFIGVTARHRYLHVVLDDLAGARDWEVQAGPRCTDTMPVVAGDVALDESGNYEAVVDLQTLSDGAGMGPRCYVFRGHNAESATYYAAYFDENPAADVSSIYPRYTEVLGLPDLPDLDVRFIERTPRLAYDAFPNRPRDGQAVTYIAHIRNAGQESLAPFTYEWVLDGKSAAQATFSRTLNPGETDTISFSWLWDSRPHQLQFRAEPSEPEVSSANNTLAVRTDALSLGFWVERSAYDYFNSEQWQYCQDLVCTGSNSFDDWLQRQVSAWNRLLASSAYPETAPAGIADRVRLDEITIVPDGSLPLHGGGSTYSPDLSDHTVDLEWGMPWEGVPSAYPHRAESASNVDWAIIHELGHARSLADLYRFDVGISDTVDVRDASGKPVFDPGDPFGLSHAMRTFPGLGNQLFLYSNTEQDLMSCVCTPFYSEYTTLVLNRLRGRRAVCGNTNPPCNLGDWFLDIPPINTLRILDRSGHRVPDGTVVRIFNDTGQEYTHHVFDDRHVWSAVAKGGVVSLPSDPFAVGTDPWAPGKNLLLVEVQAPGDDAFCFQEPTDFNRASWSGYSDVRRPATYTLRLGAVVHNGCNLQLPPPLVNEPFATSPQTSAVTVGAASGGTRTIHVTLRDDGDRPHPMRGRTVVVRDAAGRQLTAGTTGRNGKVTLTIQVGAASPWIDDVTDNHLTLSIPGPIPTPASVLRP